MAQIKIEGQTINLDDEIAESDDTLRAALQVNWPDGKEKQMMIVLNFPPLRSLTGDVGMKRGRE